MGNILYKQLTEKLNNNGEVHTITLISNTKDIGKKIILSDDDINLSNYDYINNDDLAIFKSIIKDIDLEKATYVSKVENNEIFVENIMGKPKLIICGGGHIALPLSKMGKMLEFKVTIIDDREEFANKERFPHADNVICGDFNKSIDESDVNSNSYVVIVTRGHKDDRKCLEKVIRSNARYIGMIGSRDKVDSVFKTMIDEGYSEDELKNIHSPIGLKIGAQTPEEIAVSIFAEIIEVKNKKLFSTIEDNIISKISSENQDMILATIVEKKGSSPRGAGAKMLICKDGSFVGTVGGGSVENAVYEQAKELIEKKKSWIETYDLSNSKASKLGMACGGTIRVYFEYIKANI